MTNEELVVEYQNGNQEALNELTEQNKGLVIFFANKYQALCQKAGLQYDDLVQEGWIGFINAACKYEPSEDEASASFSTYAGVAIKGKILQAINNSIPRMKKSDHSSEIWVNSIDEFLPGSEDVTLLEAIPDEKADSSFEDTLERLHQEQLRNDIMQMLDGVFGGEFYFNGYVMQGSFNVRSLLDKLNHGITPKEILLLHYGLCTEPMPFQRISEIVGVSASRIEQLEFKGLNSIRISIPGQSFMQKYEEDYVDYLKKREQSINEFSEPGKVVSQIEMFDEMLSKYAF